MYLAVDVGGTKTLVAEFEDNGQLGKTLRFETSPNYEDFLKRLAENLNQLGAKSWQAAAVAVPGRLDREHGIAIALGNLPWRNVPIRADSAKLLGCPVLIENDAKAAGLGEAIAIKNEFKNILYVTIGTGIGCAVIIDGKIDPHFANDEPGHMLLEHNGQLMRWEEFASGKAIQKQFGKHASEIDDPASWQTIAKNIAIGLIDLIATLTPEIIIVGGGVGEHFAKFGSQLEAALQSYQNQMLTVPPIRPASQPEEAVLYGCYELLKEHYGQPAS